MSAAPSTPGASPRPAVGVVETRRLRAPLPARVRARLVARLMAPIWRRRLGAFGHGSTIRRPELVFGGRSIHIGARVAIWPHARLEALGAANTKQLEICDGVVIQPYAHIAAVESVEVGEETVIASGVYITDHDHDYRDPTAGYFRTGVLLASPVRIGAHCWIGNRVMVLKGVRIGDRSIIGAGAIVTKDIPAYSIALGAPARVVRRWDDQRGAWVPAT